MPDIRFGEIDFSGDGAYIWGAGQYSAPARSVDFIEVPGRNGDLLIDNGNYTNTKAVFDVVITKDVKENTDRLKHLLYSQKGYQRLYDSDLKGFYRMASFNRGFEIPSTDGGIVRIEFDCKPFKYDISGEEKIVLSGALASAYLENPYFVEAKPLIKITGYDANFDEDYGFVELRWGMDFVQIKVEKKDCRGLIIDTDLNYAYYDRGVAGLVSANHLIELPDISLLGNCQSQIGYSGAITGMEIAPRWRTI